MKNKYKPYIAKISRSGKSINFKITGHAYWFYAPFRYQQFPKRSKMQILEMIKERGIEFDINNIEIKNNWAKVFESKIPNKLNAQIKVIPTAKIKKKSQATLSNADFLSISLQNKIVGYAVTHGINIRRQANGIYIHNIESNKYISIKNFYKKFKDEILQ